VAIVRHDLGLDEAAPLPTGPPLEQMAAIVYASRRPFTPDPTLGDLQRPAISGSVAVLSQLPLVQQAGAEWYLQAILAAQAAHAEVIVLDGRNPRQRVADVAAANGLQVSTALDLYMSCEAEEAARRVLLARGIAQPTAEQLSAQTAAVTTRRDEDRNRAERPFTAPEVSVPFRQGIGAAEAAVTASWQPEGDHELPLTIMLDNTHLAKPDMLAMVATLAATALDH
jgi:hypothetical protein